MELDGKYHEGFRLEYSSLHDKYLHLIFTVLVAYTSINYIYKKLFEY